MKPHYRSLILILCTVALFAKSNTIALASPCPSSLPYKVFLPLIIGGAGSATGIDFSGGWRLPFDGTKTISDGPNEGTHIPLYGSQEAIDYAVSGTSFPVVAPADGTVLNILLDTSRTPNFGWVIRINHNNTYSFFAHVGTEAGSQIFVKAGDKVIQGQCIAMSGRSGGQAAIHLHYEARTGITQNNVYSGQSIPIRGVPGTWWNPWYSPLPDFHDDPARFSGGAQYPEIRVRPSTVDGSARHLSNVTAPPDAINGYLSDVSGPTPAGIITFHLGASPNTPTNNSYKTLFSIYKWQSNPDRWQGWASTYGATVDDFVSFSNQSYDNGQHTYLIQANTADGNVYTCVISCDRCIELFTDGYNGIPHIIASYTRGSDATTLEYCASGAIQYEVYEYHGFTTPLAYSGPDCSILVHRSLGNTIGIQSGRCTALNGQRLDGQI